MSAVTSNKERIKGHVSHGKRERSTWMPLVAIILVRSKRFFSLSDDRNMSIRLTCYHEHRMNNETAAGGTAAAAGAAGLFFSLTLRVFSPPFLFLSLSLFLSSCWRMCTWPLENHSVRHRDHRHVLVSGFQVICCLHIRYKSVNEMWSSSSWGMNDPILLLTR